MTRFRPTVEALDARDLPSAVLADVPAAPTSAAAAHVADEPTASLNFTKITFKTIDVASTGTVQDLNFTVTVSKASPKL